MSDKQEAWRRKLEENEEEDEEDIDENTHKAQKDALLFAIDVSQTMLAPSPPSDSKKAEKDSPTTAALKCAYQVMQQRIISNPKDMMGVLLFGTEDSKFQNDDPKSGGNLTYSHCYLLTDLSVPAASDVKALKSIVEDEEASTILVPTKNTVSMPNVLFCANQIFTTKAPNFGSRRLFIITDRDDPHAGDKALMSVAAVRAKDLYDLGVIIELFPISRPDHEFDRTKFYDDIVYRDPNDADAPALSPADIRVSSGTDGISLLNSLILNVNSKQIPKRALFSNLPFEIGPGFRISVKGYNILDRQKPARKSYIWLDGERAAIAFAETTKLAEDSARTVLKDEIKRAFKFGGEQVIFTETEKKELKNFGQPVLRIIGFKPQSMLPPWASVSKSTFIYPSEEDYVGSTRVFAALWQKLEKDKKMGLAWYIPRVNANPLLIALLPSQEQLDPYTKQQAIPAGLWACTLPYADDIRSPPETTPPVVSPDILIDKMRIVVQQLQLPGARFDPAKYPNPSLQWHYRILQAMALNEEIPEFKDGDDKTIPKYKQIDKRAGHYVEQWGIALEDEYMTRTTEKKSHSGGVGVKREADEEKGAASKKPRMYAGSTKDSSGETLSSMSTDQLKKHIEAGKLSKATVAELKEWLSSNGLGTTGKKAELVERIEQFVD